MYVPGDCNILLICACDSCYRKKRVNHEFKDENSKTNGNKIVFLDSFNFLKLDIWKFCLTWHIYKTMNHTDVSVCKTIIMLNESVFDISPIMQNEIIERFNKWITLKCLVFLQKNLRNTF